MIEALKLGENLTNDIFSGIDKYAREAFLIVLARTISNLVVIDQEDK